MNALIRFYREEEGVTAIEYGLIASLIAVAIIVGCHGCWAPSSAAVFTYIAGTAEAASEREHRTKKPSGIPG